MPNSTLSLESRILDAKLKLMSTPIGGNLQGIVKPMWMKTFESDVRLAWLRDMLEKKLVVRNIEKLGHIIEENLRVESTREEELSREILVELMRVKSIDEKGE